MKRIHLYGMFFVVSLCAGACVLTFFTSSTPVEAKVMFLDVQDDGTKDTVLVTSDGKEVVIRGEVGRINQRFIVIPPLSGYCDQWKPAT